jgi:hypothetical protein
MATTDARPGFKLPWSADRTESDSNDAAAVAPASTSDEPTATAEPVADGAEPGSVHDEVPVDVNATPAESTHEAAAPFDPWRLDTAAPASVEAPKRKPNKLMADLTKAMQTAAESARDETLARLQADAKAFIETIHTRSATEAEELRHTADADIAGIREWSKAEIARIREETDQRVADRKSTLESEVEAHAGRIEQRIERVQAHVAWFETEMAGFFERLLAEEDPTALAAMAENLPEPPSFDDDMDDLPAPPAPVAAAVESAVVAESIVDEAFVTEAIAEEPAAPEFEHGSIETAPEAEAVATVEDPEAAFAAIQAAAEAAEVVEPEPVDVPVEGEPVFVDETDDPRLNALGLSPEAGTEAEAEVNPAEPAEELATFSDDALAARLAGLVPGEGDGQNADVRTTRVVVTGLVSVASIASFKRHLSRLDGVATVGVSSGPDGEFIFAVGHNPEIDLANAVTTLPGFAAQVTGTTDDSVSVAARDPETES